VIITKNRKQPCYKGLFKRITKNDDDEDDDDDDDDDDGLST